MGKMFDSYDNPTNETPDNIICFLGVDEDVLDRITHGATNIHYFKLPVDIEDVKDYVVSYKQGLEIILEKQFGECEIEILDNEVYLKCILTPEESRLFNFYNKDTFIQLSLKLQDDSIVYSDIYRLEMVDSLNDLAFEEEEEEI